MSQRGEISCLENPWKSADQLLSQAGEVLVMKGGGICPPHCVHSGDVVGFSGVKCVENLNEHMCKKSSF